MDFRDNQAIYLQIVDYICEQILRHNWKAGEKILSIRELAVELQVTPNTVQRSCDFIQQLGVISNRRGVGYFVEPDGIKKILLYKREQFIKKDLPVVFRNMYLLKLEFSEIAPLYDGYLKTIKKNNQ